MKRLSRFLCAALILFASSSFALEAQAADSVGSIGIRVAQIPAAVAEDPYADVYIISRIQPANSLMQRLEVFNTSAQEFKVNVYPGAATYVDGKFNVADGRTGNALSSWTKLSPNVLILKPGESKTFSMIISPPSDAASIQQFGVIWAEVQGSPNPKGISSVSRVGIRMYIPIGDAPAIIFSKASLASNSNQIIVKKISGNTYPIQVIYISFVLNLTLIVLVILFILRGSQERKERRRRDRREEKEWREEKRRRSASGVPGGS
jgi:hypothetical protein